MTARIIHKFILTPGEPVMMPSTCWVLTAAAQGDNICVWAEVDPLTPEQPMIFHVVPTGSAVPEFGLYLGTAFLRQGALVFHIYQEDR